MTMLTLSSYKKVSTFFTITCILYLCLVSVSHMGYQTTQRQNSDLIMLSNKGHIHGYKHHKNWTRQELNDPDNNGLAYQHSTFNNRPEIHHKAQLVRRSNEDVMSSSPKITTSSFRKEQPEARQSLTIRKLAETTKHLSIASKQAHIQTYDNQFTLETTVSKVSHHNLHVPHQDTEVLLHSLKVSHKTSGVLQRNIQFLPLGELYVYGTYLDKRYPESDYIRILVLRPSANQTRQLWCQFNGTRNRVINVKAEPYEMCENHGKRYGGWIYSCSVPETTSNQLHTISLLYVTKSRQTLDKLMSIPLQPLCTQSGAHHTSKHNLEIPRKHDLSDDVIRQTKHRTSSHKSTLVKDTNMRLGLCVPPLYGDVYLSKLINFIEMCRLLGADKIFLYIHDIPQDIVTFLQNYTGPQPDILTLVDWKLPIIQMRTAQGDTSHLIWNHGQQLAVQHCLYMNMAQFDWLLFIDIDEILVPKKADTWLELLSGEYSMNRSVAGISFESAFFQQDYQTQVSNSIDYFQYVYRTRDTSRQRSKLLVRPFQIFELGIHHLSRAVTPDMHVVKTGADECLLHHYRKCVPDHTVESDFNCQVLVKDETILRYQVPLTIASREVIAGAMKFFIHHR